MYCTCKKSEYILPLRSSGVDLEYCGNESTLPVFCSFTHVPDRPERNINVFATPPVFYKQTSPFHIKNIVINIISYRTNIVFLAIDSVPLSSSITSISAFYFPFSFISHFYITFLSYF
jgi:hypothetical protein